MKNLITMNKQKKLMIRMNAEDSGNAENSLLLLSKHGVVTDGIYNSNLSIIDRIDAKNPSQADLKELSEELSRLKETDIRTVDPSTLVDAQSVEIDTGLPVLERTIDYIKQVRNPYCYKINGVVIKAVFLGFSSVDECLEGALFGGGTSKY